MLINHHQIESGFFHRTNCVAGHHETTNVNRGGNRDKNPELSRPLSPPLTVQRVFQALLRPPTFKMKLVPRHGHEVGVLMTSLLLLLWGTLLLPEASGGTAKSKDVKCYDSKYRHDGKATKFSEDQTCANDHARDDEEACCYFIFSFGEVRTDWNCASNKKRNLDLCEGKDNSCVTYEKDPSGRSVRCVCTTPLCNHPSGWEKDPVYKQWKTHPENEKKGGGSKGKKGVKDKSSGSRSSGGVAPAGGKGDMALATVSALLLIAALRWSSASYLLVAFGTTLFLLPSTVSGEDWTTVNLTCLSSSNNASRDRHCGINTETCCYYFFRDIPNWDCTSQNYCYGSRKGRCEERWDVLQDSLGLLCNCASDGCNHPKAWENDAVYKEWATGSGTTAKVSMSALLIVVAITAIF